MKRRWGSYSKVTSQRTRFPDQFRYIACVPMKPP